MKVKILAFGQIKEIVGSAGWEIEDVADTDELLHSLRQRFPALQQVDCSVAIGQKLITGNAILNNGDTVALLPPFSGG